MINDGKKFNILYLHNESIMGGAEISLLNLVKGLNKKLFIPHFICSKEGPFIDELEKIKITPDFVQFPGIRWPSSYIRHVMVKESCTPFRNNQKRR